MKKTINSKHICSMVVYTLLSLFLCMVGVGNASAAEQLNPVVKIDKTSYTSSGMEVTLRLWMFNYSLNTSDNASDKYNARFTGDVNFYIDDQMVIKLNSVWSSIAGATLYNITAPSTDNHVDIYLDDTNVGTAQFKNFTSYISNMTEKSWYTVDLKLSFNKSFSYYGHKITVKGKWQDKSSGSVVEKDVALDNTIKGFVRPINFKVQPSGDKTMFTWEKQGYNPSASTDGKWVVYKREGDNNVKLGEVAANEQSLSIEKKQYSCSNDYIMTFLPNVCEGEETVCGLTTTATGHQINNDDICQICGHSFFRYQTSDGKMVDISKRDFGANVVAHKVVDGKCVIEFDAPITKIPANAFLSKRLTGNLVIPNSVTEIGDNAFNSCSGLKGKLTIPNSVITIGNSAFSFCSGFTGDLTIPNSVTTIGNEAFSNCSGFTGDLTIPNSVTTIGESAFNGCTGFTGDLTIPNSVTTIGNKTFKRCTGFNGKLTIPNSVTTIGNSVFFGCKGFTGDLTIPDSVTTIGESAFDGCTGFNGNLTISNSVTTIGNSAFSYCSGFNGNLTIPNSVTTIGESAFSRCSGFTGDLTIPNSVTTIGISAFNGCSGFTGKLTISNSVTTIEKYAFFGCKGFTGDLAIPNSVITIGESAFSRCSGFTGDLTIPNSVTTIGESAFSYCSGFKGKLTISNSVTTIGNKTFEGCFRFTGKLTIPNSVTTIGESAFSNCYGFTGDLTIPNSVTTIGNSAFRNCSGFTGDLTISNSVTTIGNSAFSYCSRFTGDLSLPKSLEVVGYRPFEYCENIQTINFQSLPKGISEFLGVQKKTVSLSDDSYISDKAIGTVNAISYTRTMTSNWGTLVLPYSLTLTGNEPYRLYTIDNMTGEELVLKQLDGEVAAGTPCVVKRNGTESELTFRANNAELNMARVAQNVGGMTFRGTYWTEDVANGYIIAKDCFWNVEELKNSSLVNGVKVHPFRAWLDGTSANAPARLSMRIDGSITGIDAIDALNDVEAEYYDLSGKRLDEPQRGVNIVRMKSGKTKKIIIK